MFNEPVKNVRKIAFAICISNFVSMVSYLALSIWILMETSSYLLSSIIFGCQWILPLVWPTGIATLTEKWEHKKIASWSEWTSAILSIAIIGAVASKIYIFVIIFVMLRGFCDSLTRTTVSLIVKLNIEDEKLVERGISKIEFLRVVGTSAAGVFYSILGEHQTIYMFLLYSFGILTITGVIYRRLDLVKSISIPESKQITGGFLQLKGALISQPTVAKWLWLLAAVAAFQGVHNAIRVAYPDQQLGQGITGVGIVSTISTVGILIGGWLVDQNKIPASLRLAPGWILVSIVGILGSTAVFISTPIPSYAIYFGFMILFEITFMLFNINLVTNTDNNNISAILGFRTTILNASTLLGLIITSIFLTRFSASWSTLFTALLLVGVSVYFTYRYKQR